MVEESTVSDDREYEEAFEEFSGGSPTEVAEEQETEEVIQETEQEEESSDEPIKDQEQYIGDEPDDFKQKFEDLQRRNEELEHSVKSNNGRVSALQKKIDSYESKPVDEEQNQDIDDLNTDSSVFEEDYPDIAEYIKEQNDNINKDINKRFEPMQQQDQQRYVDSQVSLLSKDYPDWQDQVASDGFKSWLDEQPQPVREMINSVEASDYSYLLGAYGVNKSQEANDIQMKRKEKLAANEVVPSSGVSKKTIAPDDFDAAFDYYARNRKN